jgi:hypothetical protein
MYKQITLKKRLLNIRQYLSQSTMSLKWPTVSSILPQDHCWKCSTEVPKISKIMIAAANITSSRILCTCVKYLIIIYCLFIRLVRTAVQYGTKARAGTSNFWSFNENSGLYLKVCRARTIHSVLTVREFEAGPN